MKMTLAAIVGGIALLAVILGSVAFDADAAPATLTGCLREGSAGGVRLLRSATAGGESGAPRDYLLVSVAEGVNLDALLNRQVAIEGDAFGAGQGPEPPSGANAVERALRRLSVRSARQVAETCSAG